MSELIILNLNGSVITKLSDGKGEISKEHLSGLSNEIGEAKNKRAFRLLVTHDWGNFLYRKGLTKVLLASGMEESIQKLNFEIVKSLQSNGVKAESLPPANLGFIENEKFRFFESKNIKKKLDANIVPVTHANFLHDKIKGYRLLTSDALMVYLAEELNAHRIIFGTRINGILDEDGKSIKKITSLNLEKVIDKCANDDTGVLIRNIIGLVELAENLGVEIEIISALEKGFIKRALLGEKDIGTTIECRDLGIIKTPYMEDNSLYHFDFALSNELQSKYSTKEEIKKVEGNFKKIEKQKLDKKYAVESYARQEYEKLAIKLTSEAFSKTFKAEVICSIGLSHLSTHKLSNKLCQKGFECSHNTILRAIGDYNKHKKTTVEDKTTKKAMIQSLMDEDLIEADLKSGATKEYHIHLTDNGKLILKNLFG